MIPWKSLLASFFCAIPLLATPLSAQDDNGSPPPDATASAPDDDTGAPDSSASFQTFYDSLSSQGTWIQSSDYGYVWQPQVSDPDWAPYTEGHWVYTDDGWTWVSDEPWGWATYHYGRWVNLDGTGWCWVPGYRWAPAWVSWRYGDGYAGWAPLPPDSFVGIDYSDDGLAIGVGFHIGGDCDGFYGIGAGWYNFLPVSCLGYEHYRGYYLHRGDNFALINHTTNVTNINVTASAGGGGFHHVTTGGPMLEQVNAVSQTPVQRATLVRAGQPGGGGTFTGNSLALYAPRVNVGGAARPPRVEASIGQAPINRGTDILRPLAANSRLTPGAATESQVQAARLAQNHVPANAKVLTDGAPVSAILQGPLTALKPVAQTAPSSAFNEQPKAVPNAERAPHNAPVVPTVRTYPQTDEQGNVPSNAYYPGTVYPSRPPAFEPHSAAPAPGGTPVGHSYAPSAAPAVRPSGNISPGGAGGYSNGGGAGNSRSGGPAGGNSPQTH
jgi:hypothetical protein